MDIIKLITEMIEKEPVVGVDSGILWVGDPCYIFKDWEKFLKKLEEIEKPEDEGITQFDRDLGHPGKGCVIRTYAGDGTYDINAERDEEGRVKRIIIDFTKTPNEE